MPTPSPREALDRSLQRLHADVPATFAVDAASALHETVQRFVASGLANARDTFDAALRDHTLTGLFTIRAPSTPTADGRRWTQLLAVADPRYSIGTFDEGVEDPLLYIASVEDNWDDRANAPGPGGARPLVRLGELLAKLERRGGAATAATTAELAPFAIEGELPDRRMAPLLGGGRGALVAVARRDAPPDRTQEGVAIVERDRTSVVPLQATHAKIVAAAAWAGEDVVVLGRTKMLLTHVGVLRRGGDAWTAQELWAASVEDAAQLRFEGHVVAGPDVFAFATRVSSAAQEHTIHVWQRGAAGWSETARQLVPHPLDSFVLASPARILCAGHVGATRVVHELALAPTGVTMTEQPSARLPGYATLVGDVAVTPEQLAAAALPGASTPIILRAGDDGVIVLSVADNRESSLVGFVVRGGALVRWFELAGASISDGRMPEKPEQLAVAGDTLYASYGGAVRQLRRLTLPARP